MGELLEGFHGLYDFLRSTLPGPLHPYITPGLVTLLFLLVGLGVRELLLKRLYRYTQSTANPYDQILMLPLRRRFAQWSLLLGLLLALPETPWDREVVTVAQIIVTAVFIISLSVWLSRTLSKIVISHAGVRGSTVGETSLIKYVIYVVTYTLGIVVILSMFGVSVAPALTALGIGGLAVALAFQDTLGNLFAGITITLNNQIRVGDYIEMEGGPEGFVYDIGWRNTVIRPFSNNLVIVPNKKLADTIVTNFNLPDGHLQIELTFGVGYEHDPEEVERVLLDECARSVGVVSGLLDDPPPMVRLKAFGDSALQFRLLVTGSDPQLKIVTSHQMMKRIYARFKSEGITIPYPTHRVMLDDTRDTI